MRKIIAGAFITLDGVMEAPGNADITLPEQRGWSEPFMIEEIGNLLFEQIQESDALLLGRRTYQDFAAFWPQVPADDPFGMKMNGMTKYVVSTTLDALSWNNSCLISKNVITEITRLKQKPGQTIQMMGSGDLFNSLLHHNLIDEFHLMICPVVLGIGKRLFKDGNAPRSMRLASTRAFDSGMIVLNYEPVRIL